MICFGAAFRSALGAPLRMTGPRRTPERTGKKLSRSRKPSCLISCSHGLPEGSLSVLVGRHGAMNPAGTVRCNIMLIARGYSRVSQPLFLLQASRLGIVSGRPRVTSPLDVSPYGQTLQAPARPALSFTPAANSWRTPPVRPRASARTVSWPSTVKLSFSAFWNATGGRAFYCRPPHGSTFNQRSALKRGGLPNPAPAILIGGGVRFSFPPPALSERRHRGLASLSKAVRWRAIFMVAAG